MTQQLTNTLPTETELTSLSYGINAQDRVQISSLPDMTVTGPPLSMNAYIDIHTGYQLASLKSGWLVYCKHALPMFAIDTEKASWKERLQQVLEVNSEREFGCFVFNGTVNREIFEAIADYRFHTLGAPAITPDVVRRIMDGKFQERNRKVVIATGAIPLETHQRHSSETSVHKIVYDVSLPTDETMLQRCVRLCRTLCVCIESKDGDLILSNSGFVDPIEAIRFSFAMLDAWDFRNLVVGTDACFGVKNPARLLAKHSVSKCVLFGPKNTGSDLVAAFEQHGIILDWSAGRAFRLSV